MSGGEYTLSRRTVAETLGISTTLLALMAARGEGPECRWVNRGHAYRPEDMPELRKIVREMRAAANTIPTRKRSEAEVMRGVWYG